MKKLTDSYSILEIIKLILKTIKVFLPTTAPKYVTAVINIRNHSNLLYAGGWFKILYHYANSYFLKQKIIWSLNPFLVFLRFLYTISEFLF